MMLWKALCLLLLLVCTLSKLHQVLSMFRHGARYHLYPIYDYKATERLRGELTAVGMRCHENLGKMLRKDYIEELHFLSESYQVN